MPSLAPAEGFRLLEQELHLAQHQHGGIELGRDGLDDARPGFRKLADQLEEEIVAIWFTVSVEIAVTVR